MIFTRSTVIGPFFSMIVYIKKIIDETRTVIDVEKYTVIINILLRLITYGTGEDSRRAIFFLNKYVIRNV